MRLSVRHMCGALIPFSTQASVLIGKLTDMSTPIDEVVSVSNDLASLPRATAITASQAVSIAATLAARGVRHEPVLEQCFWTVYKTPHPQTNGESWWELAENTVNTFDIMVTNGFVNDSQLLILGLGRCIECAPFLTARGIGRAYHAIVALQRGHFSLAEVGLQESSITSEGTLRDALTEQEGAPSSETIAHQPNLIDVTCSALESQMAHLSLRWMQSDMVQSADGAASIEQELSDWVFILQSASQVGLSSDDALRSFTTVLAERHTLALSTDVLTDALSAAMQLHERVVDVLNHEESAFFADSRDSLVVSLANSLRQVALKDKTFRHNPTVVLRLRRLFEQEPVLFDQAPLLWDQVRSAKISHRESRLQKTRVNGASAAVATGSRGKILDKRFAVKTKRITSDLSDAERFVPPEFKTWRSPQHTPRGGHQGRNGAPRKAAFGTRRISKNYLRDRRRRYAQK